MAVDDLTLFTGNANPALTSEVADRLGIGIGRALVGTFSDGEASVEVMDTVRGADAFVIEPTCMPASNHLMELLVMIDALRRCSVVCNTAATTDIYTGSDTLCLRAALVTC
jgi:ribose-phosphate pyrophosphokinase